MNRRDFLCSTGAASAAVAFPLGKWTGRPFARSRAAGGWRTLDVTTRVAGSQKKGDRKSTPLNSSHSQISYAVFCLKKKKKRDKSYLIINEWKRPIALDTSYLEEH